MTENPKKSARWAELSHELPESVKSGLEIVAKSLDTVAHPRDDAGMGGDRRRNETPGDSPMDILTQLPAVVVLERIPVPALAIARDGIVLFANAAFAEMMGYRQERLAGLASAQIFHGVPPALLGVDALANLVVELRHRDGWTVRARMSKSALMRSDDPLVLVTFENLTEQLWVSEL